MGLSTVSLITDVANHLFPLRSKLAREQHLLAGDRSLRGQACSYRWLDSHRVP